MFSIVRFVKCALLVLFASISIGQGTDDNALSTATIILPSGDEDSAKSAPLKIANSGSIIGNVTANIVNDSLVVVLKWIEEEGASMDRCVMRKTVFRRSGGTDERINKLDTQRISRQSVLFETDMKLVKAYCDMHSALDKGEKKDWNGSYSIIGGVFFQCNTLVDDVPGNVQPCGQGQPEAVKTNYSAPSLCAARNLRHTVPSGETVISHFEIVVACATPDPDGSVDNRKNTSIPKLHQGGPAMMYMEDQLSICPEVDLAPCPERSVDCVADLLWDQRPLPFVPSEGEDDASEFNFNGRTIWKYKVKYTSTDRAVGKPFTEDKHRALILTQPKVGTNAIWNSMSHISDFVLRSHEVGILRQNNLWVPFPGCTAKPANGECTVVLAFRDPRAWLDSAYFQFRSKIPRRNIIPKTREEVRAYHEFLRDAVNRTQILHWWRIAEQLRLLGIPSTSVTPLMKSVMDNGGVKILAPENLPKSPWWISGCNVIVLQMEMARYGTPAERTMRSILPDFRFHNNYGRVHLNPELEKVYSGVKEATLPSDTLELMFKDSADFHEAWKLYHKPS